MLHYTKTVRKKIEKILKLFQPIVFTLCFGLFAFNAHAATTWGPITVPTSTTISRGTISLSASNLYGGAAVYYKDSAIPDTSAAKGNIIDFSQGGALLSHAIWTFPRTLKEQQLCYTSQQKVLKIPEFTETDLACNTTNKDSNDECYCKYTIPHNNPTQGGSTGDGWYGNVNTKNNPSSVTVVNNTIKVSTRLVNFNFAFNKGSKGSDPRSPYPDASNTALWQTDMWIDQTFSFHPTLQNVIVVDTKVTYCKDGNAGCAKKPIMFADNQIMTMFTQGLNAKYGSGLTGPYARLAYFSKTTNTYEIYGTKSASDPRKIPRSITLKAGEAEDWVAALHNNQNMGVGISIKNYQGISSTTATSNNHGGYHMGDSDGWPTLTAIRPQLDRFQNTGITRVEVGEPFSKNIPAGYDLSNMKIFDWQTDPAAIKNDVNTLFSIMPGGSFTYRGFMATGTLDQIRGALKQANISDTTPLPTTTTAPTATRVPTPTATTPPRATDTPLPCSLKPSGDANCDGLINLNDFERFRQEYTGLLASKTSDFNADAKISLMDFEVWRRNFK